MHAPRSLSRRRGCRNEAMDAPIFQRHDPLTGDGIRVDRDGDRLRFRFHVEGAAATLWLVDRSDVVALAEALSRALRTERPF